MALWQEAVYGAAPTLYSSLLVLANSSTWGGQESLSIQAQPSLLPYPSAAAAFANATAFPPSLSLLTLANGTSVAVVDLAGAGAAVYTLPPALAQPQWLPSSSPTPQALGSAYPAVAYCSDCFTGNAAALARFSVIPTAATGSSTPCTLAVTLGALTLTPGAPPLNATSLQVCIVQSEPALANMSSLSISASSYAAASGRTWVGLAVSYAAGGRAHLATLCAPMPALPTLPFELALVNSPLLCWPAAAADAHIAPDASQWAFPQGTLAPLPTLPGANSKVSTFSLPRSATGPGVQVLVGGSACLNSEARNKAARIALCEAPIAPPSSSAYTAYLTGTLARMGAVLQGGEAGFSPQLQPHCSRLIAAGGVGQGALPAPTAWWDEASGTAQSLGAQVGVSAQAGDPLSCGAAAAVPAPGAVQLFSWPLASTRLLLGEAQ